jgi:hypothetical protein
MSARVTLPEPIEIAKFWKNRRGEAIIITVKEYEGKMILDIRTHFTTKDGKLQATTKGLALMVRRVPELAAGVQKALTKLIELGLVGEGDDE